MGKRYFCRDCERLYLPIVSQEVGGTGAVFRTQILNRSGDAIQRIFHAAESDCERVYLFMYLAKPYLHICTQFSESILRREGRFQFCNVRIGNHAGKCITVAMKKRCVYIHRWSSSQSTTSSRSSGKSVRVSPTSLRVPLTHSVVRQKYDSNRSHPVPRIQGPYRLTSAFALGACGAYTARMRQSKLFTRTRREAPSDEVAKNAQLLVRAGYIHKEMAGVYDYLPLGLRTLNKIINIIREEMNAIGGEEVFLSALQNPESWKKSGRWDDAVIDVWFKTQLKNGGELGLGNTHEEALTALMTEHIASYKDLPRYVYQFQNKFRNETRAKSGIMRAREFIMKDLYSFSADAASHDAFYEKVAAAYENIFKRAGIGEKTYRTVASGGSFSKFSHEYQTVCVAGEDTIYIDAEKRLAVNKEVYDDQEVYAASGLTKETLTEAKAIEVGNIFTLGTRFSEALGLSYKDAEGKPQPVFMGSYGIGPGRLMGTIVELLSDEKGLVWPESVAPFAVHLVSLGKSGDEVSQVADALYEDFVKAGVEVLYDDRDTYAGQKFAESDLIGIPKPILVGKDAVATGSFEVVGRATGTVAKKTRAELLA